MRQVAGIVLFATLGSLALPGQTFEVASIKPNTSGSNGSSTGERGGEWLIKNYSLEQLIELAYQVQTFQISAPDWANNVKFDVVAKCPPELKGPERGIRLRALLEERFKLRAHHEKKEMPAYALTVAKGGFKLKPSETKSGSWGMTTGKISTINAQKAPMETLVEMLTRAMQQPVVDQTAITGIYDFKLRWSPDDQAAPLKEGDADSVPSLFAAIQEQLGLRLQKQKLPIDIVVVDHAERVPIEN